MTEQTLDRGDPETLFRVQVGEPVEYRGIVVAPLFPLRDPVARYTTLDEALERGFEITETGPDGTVPELAASNPLDDSVLLYDGEELVGAKQNRILDVSVLVAARSQLAIPVSCVEQGRWRSVSPLFSAAGHVSNAELRRVKSHALAARGRARGAAQGEVWRAVHEKLERLEVPSPTAANHDAFSAHRQAIAGLEAAFPALPGQCGAVLGLADALCLDAVSRPDAFVALWPKLRTGYLLDALDQLDRRATRTERIHGFVDEVAQAPAERSPAAGLGVDVRLRGPGVLGAGLELDGELIQLSAFTIEADRPAQGRIARPSRRSA